LNPIYIQENSQSPNKSTYISMILDYTSGPYI
jgi:hypothetical protein